MASARKLPAIDVLLEHVNKGLTNQEIGDLYGTTGEAVRQQLAARWCETEREPAEPRSVHPLEGPR
jgi:hypothetical protein